MALILPHNDVRAVALHIIIAEDQATIGTIITQILRWTYPGSVITTVRNGKEALRVYEQMGADLIITDRYMPLMDGLTLIAAIRAQDVTVPIVLISAVADSMTQRVAVDQTQFLMKPFMFNQLVDILSPLGIGFSHQAT